MSGKHHENYGPILYARVLIHLKEAGTPQTVTNVADAVLHNDYTKLDRMRVLNVLNKLAKTNQVLRDSEQSRAKHVNRYIFSYIQK